MQGWIQNDDFGGGFDDFDLDSIPSSSKRSRAQSSSTSVTAAKEPFSNFAVPFARGQARKSLTSAASSSRRRMEDDFKPWIDRHAPVTSTDLAVHPKKIDEVKFWLNAKVVR